jgi:hypothetical protein
MIEASPGVCAGCGTPLPPRRPGRGRPRKWCSPRCAAPYAAAQRWQRSRAARGPLPRCNRDGCTSSVPTRKHRYCDAHRGGGRSPFARDELGRKRCPKCHMWKPEQEFHRQTSAADGFGSCAVCGCEASAAHRYKLGKGGRERLLAQQGGRCAICGTDDPGRGWVVDHDHACCGGKYSCGTCVRGVLCYLCNNGLGLFRDDPVRMKAAIDYLSRPLRLIA